MSEEQNNVKADFVKTVEDYLTKTKNEEPELNAQVSTNLKVAYDKLLLEKSAAISDLETNFRYAEEEVTELEAQVENLNSKLEATESKLRNVVMVEKANLEADLKTKYHAMIASLTEAFHKDKELTQAEVSGLKARVSQLENAVSEALSGLSEDTSDTALSALNKLDKMEDL